MAFTFGGGTGDDITAGGGRVVGGSATAAFFAGWWYPTTLTATRGYCSAGNTWGMEVDSTTSQLRWRTDNTTDGQWTAPAGITVDKWWFIAFAVCHFNTGPAAAIRCWVGDDVTPPAEITVTNAVAPVGNFTGNSAVYVGNKGTGTLAFQGDVGCMTAISCPTDKNSPLGIATNGAITDNEALWLLQRWVTPLWQGTPVYPGGSSVFTHTFFIMHFPLRNQAVYTRCSDPAISSSRAATVNGATVSARRPPREPPPNWVIQATAV